MLANNCLVITKVTIVSFVCRWSCDAEVED